MTTWKSHSTKWGRPREQACRVRGTQIERRAKRPRLLDLYGPEGIAADFNRAFRDVFCATRPWLLKPDGWKFDPFLKPKTNP